jgi:hypothetical protein
MAEANNEFRVQGLTPLQVAEIRAALAPVGGSVVAEEIAPMQGDKHGEPALLTVAIIHLAPPIIAALALWISKQKEHNRRKFRYVKISPDGTQERISLDLSSYQEGASSASAIEACIKKVFDGSSGN